MNFCAGRGYGVRIEKKMGSVCAGVGAAIAGNKRRLADQPIGSERAKEKLHSIKQNSNKFHLLASKPRD